MLPWSDERETGAGGGKFSLAREKGRGLSNEMKCAAMSEPLVGERKGLLIPHEWGVFGGVEGSRRGTMEGGKPLVGGMRGLFIPAGDLGG